MEKLTGAKHNHLFTDLIKVAIFGLMLLLPFLCFLPTGFYYGFNEHATNETTTQINYKYQSNEIETYNDFVQGNLYQINNLYLGNDDFEFTLNIYKFAELNLNGNGITTDDFDFSNYDINKTQMLLNFNQSAMWMQINYNDSYIAYSFTSDDELEFTDLIFSVQDNLQGFIEYNRAQGNVPTDYFYTDYNVIESVETNVQDTISNKMYLAWEGVWTSPLFNWTNTTPLNTGLKGFISIFGINQSSYIANCLIYLLSITAIYVVFDIVLGIFKWLTHLINK